MNLEIETRNNPDLKQRINYLYLCTDPFLSLLKAPDARLSSLTQSYGNHTIEVQNLKNRILSLIPAQDRILDQRFNQKFENGLSGLGYYS